MKTPFKNVFLILGLCLLASPVLAQKTVDLETGALASAKLETVNYRFWIPEGDGPLNGVLVLIPGRHGDGRGMAEQASWQDVAKDVRFAILACQFSGGDTGHYQSDPDGTLCKAINETVEKLGAENGHPELKEVPLAFWGTSAGSNVSSRYCNYYPERVAAFASSKGTWGPGGEMPNGKDEIPMLFAIGKTDKAEWVETSLKSVEAGREGKTPWTLALHPNEGHGVGNSMSVVYPFLKAAIRLRLGLAPDAPATGLPPKTRLEKIDVKDGWLGDVETLEIAAYDTFPGKKRKAVWLPDEATAKAWQAYLKK
jgi:pimeloyl-ACP methyl ester carboxylesterase